MRGAGEHELKATLVSLAPARTCSSTGQLQRSSIWNLRHRPRLLLASPAALQPTIDNPRAVPQHEGPAQQPQQHWWPWTITAGRSRKRTCPCSFMAGG